MKIDDLTKRSLIISFVLCGMYVLPLVIANSYYIDDLGRAITGSGWDQDGRILSSFIMRFISLGVPISDIFPFNLIIACILIIVPLSLMFSRDKKRSILSVSILPLLFITSPFFLENLSYRYDSIPMALSVSAVALPFIFINNRSNFALCSVIGIVISLLTYQSTATSYFILLALFLLRDVKEGDYIEFVKRSAVGALAFVIAVILSKLAWHFGDFDMRGRDTLIFSEAEPLKLLRNNFIEYINLLSRVMKSWYVITLIPIIALFVFSYYLYIKRSCVRTPRLNIAGTILSLIILICVFLCSIGANLILSSPWWTPRTMVGYAFLLTFIAFFVIDNTPNRRPIVICASITIAYSFMLSANYGNALRIHDEFNDKIASLIYPYISESDGVQIAIDGIIPEPKRLNLMKEKIPMIHTLVPTYINNSVSWGPTYFKQYDMIKVDSWLSGSDRIKVIADKCSLPVVYSNKFFTLRMKNKLSIIDFKKDKC